MANISDFFRKNWVWIVLIVILAIALGWSTLASSLGGQSTEEDILGSFFTIGAIFVVGFIGLIILLIIGAIIFVLGRWWASKVLKLRQFEPNVWGIIAVVLFFIVPAGVIVFVVITLLLKFFGK